MDLKTVIDTRRKGEPDILLFILIFVLAGIGIAMCYIDELIRRGLDIDEFAPRFTFYVSCHIDETGLYVGYQVDGSGEVTIVLPGTSPF